MIYERIYSFHRQLYTMTLRHVYIHLWSKISWTSFHANWNELWGDEKAFHLFCNCQLVCEMNRHHIYTAENRIGSVNYNTEYGSVKFRINLPYSRNNGKVTIGFKKTKE